MAIISLLPGYFLPENIDSLDIDEHLADNQHVEEKIIEKDIIIETSSDASIEELIEWVNSIEATEAQLIEHNGYSKVQEVKHRFDLHLAARDGDIAKIIRLIENGEDVNLENNRSARPLHCAALYGKVEAAKLLITYGADLHDVAYKGHTALHFALKNHHYELAKLLVLEGASPSALNEKGEDPISYLLSDVAWAVSNEKDIHAQIELVEIMDTLLVLLQHAENGCVSSAEFTRKDGQQYYVPRPVVADLYLFAAYATEPVVKHCLLNYIKEINAFDTSFDSYLHALNLLHRFPTGEIYPLTLNKETQIYLESEGHFGLFTTQLARNSLQAYLETIPHDAKHALQKNVFETLLNVYENAAYYCENRANPQAYKAALAHYDNGDTVLLPTGWHGHFVDVILSKQQETYASANSGDRYGGEDPLPLQERIEFGDTPGLIFYHLEEPNSIDEDYIQNTLNNTSQMNLEFEQPLKYATFNKLFEIINPDQEFGNCGWESHRDAVEGIIVIELLNRNISLEEAKPLAKEFYDSWDLFHGNYVIDQYMAHHPGLGAEAFISIFCQLHHNKTDISPKDHAHAEKILDTLMSDKYMGEFAEFLHHLANEPECHQVLEMVQQEYNLDVNAILAQNPINTTTETMDLSVATTPAIAEKIPTFNIAHLMMMEHHDPIIF